MKRILLFLGAKAEARANTLREIETRIAELPALRQIYAMLDGCPQELIFNEAERDLAIAFCSLFGSSALVSDDEYNFMLRRFAQKALYKGGMNAQLTQLIDIIYQCNVYLGIASFVPNVDFPSEKEGSADIINWIYLHNGINPTKLTLECKDIRRYGDEKYIAEKVIHFYAAAKQQFIKRKPTLDEDFFVFVDLPAQYAARDGLAYEKVTRIVRDHFKAEESNSGETRYSFDCARIIYTATFQENMTPLLEGSQYKGLTLLRPLVYDEICLSFARILFLSFFYRDLGQAANIFNFGKVAFHLSDEK